MRQWAESGSFVPTEQSGFCSGYLLLTRVLSFYQEVKNNMTANIPTPAVHVDYQKAYGKVWHKGLIVKFCRMGVSFRVIEIDYLMIK